MPTIKKQASSKSTKQHPNKSICTQAHLEIARTIPRPIIQEYQSSISSGINKFISNHKSKLQNLLDTSSAIQSNHPTQSPISSLSIQSTKSPHTAQLRVVCRHLHLADDSEAAPFKIPSFIDIFQHLITLSAITKQLTTDELAELKRILSLPSRHDIYQSLHHSPVGNRLALVYASVGHQIDLTQQFPTTDFHSLLFNSFTSYTILELIETQMNHISICTLTYAGKKYPNFLYIFHHGRPKVGKLTRTSLLDRLEVDKIAEQIARRVMFLGDVIQSKELPNRLIIFLTDAKKEIDNTLEHQAHFRALNVNTAVTNMHDIIIYRREELYKSIFHELIHFHNLDFKRLPAEINTMLLEYLHRTHNISPENEYLLYEAITESLANTLNAAYLSRGMRDFSRNLAREILFSTFQAAKILQVCGYSSWSEFTLQKEIPSNPSGGKQWRQDSCVFSYYILKLYILLNLDTYWTNLLDTRMKFLTIKSHFTYLLNIFNNGRVNPQLRNIIDYLLIANSNNNNNTNNTSGSYKKPNKTNNITLSKHDIKRDITQDKINKTLRMTCLDG